MVASQSRGANRKTIIHTEKSSNEGGVCNLKRKINSSFFVKTVRMSWQKQIENKICGGKKKTSNLIFKKPPPLKKNNQSQAECVTDEKKIIFVHLWAQQPHTLLFCYLLHWHQKLKRKKCTLGKKQQVFLKWGSHRQLRGFWTDAEFATFFYMTDKFTTLFWIWPNYKSQENKTSNRQHWVF